MGGMQTGAEGNPGLPLHDGGLGIPASSSTSSAFPAAVSLETGSRKGHCFPLGKVGGQAVQQFLAGRGMDGRLWLLCCPAPAMSGRILPSQGSSTLWRGTAHSRSSPVLHISICFRVRTTQHLDPRPHGGGDSHCRRSRGLCGEPTEQEEEGAEGG